jgi:CheY-like chemotaxis protein
VVIRCKDNGQGIVSEYQQQIFEPFSRVPRTELGYGEASVGLGLALVKQLTELHAGKVSVKSGGAGLGSEFTVRLPIVAPPSVRDTVEKSVTTGTSRRPRSVVIVEDNPSVAMTLQAALEQAGHSVQRFADGPSALDAMTSLHPEALLIDIGLPGMDGYELAAKLRQQANTKGALIVALSGFRRREPVNGDDGFDQYFNKPVDVAALLALLEQD